jgi:hypothetical protein
MIAAEVHFTHLGASHSPPGSWTFRIRRPSHRAEEQAMTAMDAIPVLLIVWAAILACFLGLLAYKGQLTRYEEDQLFLNDTVSHEQQFQTEIIRKVTKIQPFVRVFGVATAIMTAGIIGIFTYDAWQHLK